MAFYLTALMSFPFRQPYSTFNDIDLPQETDPVPMLGSGSKPTNDPNAKNGRLVFMVNIMEIGVGWRGSREAGSIYNFVKMMKHNSVKKTINIIKVHRILMS